MTATFNVTSTLSVATGADGRYILADLPEQFTLSVVAPDYAPAERTLSRATSFDLALRPAVLTGMITDRYSGQAVAGATITAGTARATSGPDGRYRLEGLPATATSVEISADGYATLSQELPRSTVLDAVLRPDTLRGRLIDKNTGKPLPNAAILATTTYPGVAVAFERIAGSNDGTFTLTGVPEQGYLQVLAPGYRTMVLPIKPGEVPTEIALERFRVKALYVTAAVASAPALLEEYLQLIDRTELNAIVIDLKSDLRDDLGLVYYDPRCLLRANSACRDLTLICRPLCGASRTGGSIPSPGFNSSPTIMRSPMRAPSGPSASERPARSTPITLAPASAMPISTRPTAMSGITISSSGSRPR